MEVRRAVDRSGTVGLRLLRGGRGLAFLQDLDQVLDLADHQPLPAGVEPLDGADQGPEARVQLILARIDPVSQWVVFEVANAREVVQRQVGQTGD